MKIKTLSFALLLSGMSLPAMAITASGGAAIHAGSPQADLASSVLAECETNPACPCDIAEDLLNTNIARQNAEIADMVETAGRPTKTTEMDCFSTLNSIELYGSLPSLSDIAKSVYEQAKQAACNVALSKSRELMGNVGLDFNQDLGGSFVIPGTNESIDIDAGGGGINTGFNTGRSNSTGTSYQESVTVGDDGASVNIRGEAGSNSNDVYEKIKSVF